jgi:hypothetical protein
MELFLHCMPLWRMQTEIFCLFPYKTFLSCLCFTSQASVQSLCFQRGVFESSIPTIYVAASLSNRFPTLRMNTVPPSLIFYSSEKIFFSELILLPCLRRACEPHSSTSRHFVSTDTAMLSRRPAKN